MLPVLWTPIANSEGFYITLFSEIAYVGVLHNSHFQLATLMLNAGKHVLCEKPLTVNNKQAKELCQLAKSKNLFLMEVRKK